MAALLDLEPLSFTIGDEMPFPWSALLFGELAQQKEIGQDGHPKRGGFLPPIALPRRRFAGRSISLHHPLRIGDAVERQSSIVDVTEKQGRSGKLVFVTILHEVSGPSGPAITERQKIVYLGAEPKGTAPAVPGPGLPRPDWQRSATPDPVMLFRYSALTNNGHRIHYDNAYAQEVEGYADLVVNGGLTTLFLLEDARAHLGRPIREYEVRASSPLYVARQIDLHGARTNDGALLWATNDEGRVAMQIEVRC